MNLLKETEKILKENGKSFDDVKWIGNKDYYIDIDKFIEVADTEYDDDYGGAKVALDLIIVGKDWWLERAEYDGLEWWDYRKKIKKPKKKLDLKNLTVNQYEEKNDGIYPHETSLKSMNIEKDD